VKKYRAIFIGAGVAILALLFYSFGVQKTIDDILAMGWRFWIIAGIFLFNNIFMTAAWKVLINHPIRASYYPQLFLARVAGDSTSSVNAMASAAGEALKAIYIRDVVPFKTGLASVVLDRTVHIISNVLMMLTGIFISFFVLNIPRWISTGTLVAFILVRYALMVVLRKQRQGFVRYLLTRVPRRWLDRFMNEKRWEKVDTLDGEIAFVFSSRETMKSFYASLVIHYLSGFFFSSLEIYLIVIFSGNEISFVHSMFLYIFSMFLTSVIFFMPANLGTSEGSFSLALRFLGYDPAIGLTVGLIKRLRTLVWSLIGILILFFAGMTRKN
jgi:hypothetical protein